MRLSVFVLRTVCIYWRKGEVMKKIRYLPFGYTITKGEIGLQPQEALIVQNVFKWYLEGETMQRIADRLNCQEVRYSDTAAVWTKNMVYRILECEKYCTDTKLPALITSDIFYEAYAQRKIKANPQQKELALIRKRAVCAHCSNKIYFRAGSEQWKCQTCGMKTDKMTAAKTLDTIESLLNNLSSHPETLRSPEEKNNLFSLELNHLMQEISRAFNQRRLDVDHLTGLLLSRSSKQYNLLGAGAYDPLTLRLKEILEQKESAWNMETDIAFFEQVVEKVVVERNGSVRLQLINGQLIP